MKYFVLLIIVACFSLTSNIKAQNCEQFHSKKCSLIERGNKISSQSRSALFKLGHSSSFDFLALRGKEYFIQVCYDDNLQGLEFNVSSENNNDIHTNNTGENYVSLLVKESTLLTVNISVPESEVDIEKLEADDIYGCVGILIEYKKIRWDETEHWKNN